MSESIVYISHFRVKEGKRDALIRMNRSSKPIARTVPACSRKADPAGEGRPDPRGSGS
ncbi:MAG: hypothetical protein WEE50_04640 [Chloroflexota bacterium]